MNFQPDQPDQPDTPTRSIVVDFDVPQPPASVWRALTEPDLVAQWLMPNTIEPRVGHQFTFSAQPMAGWDGTVHADVLVAEPTHRLQYTWRGGDRNATAYGHFLDTTVTWTLTQTPSGGTHVRLEHAGFTADDTFAYENMGKGWRSNVATALARVVASLPAA